MDTERDVIRIVRSWLRADEHESADQVLDNVLALLDATPQRRSWWPVQRSANMNIFAKIATVAAAAVVVAVAVGISLRPSGGTGGGPTPSPSPSHSPSPSPTSKAVAFPPSGELAVGRHSMIREGVSFSLNVPSPGWSSQQGFEFIKGPEGAPDGASFIFWSATPDNVFSDPCKHTPLDPAAGPGLASLASAVSTIPGTTLVSGPTDVAVGGHPAKRVVIMIPEGVDCDMGPRFFFLWYEKGMGSGAGRFPTVLPSTIRVWIVDVDGAVVWIDGETYKGASRELDQEMQQIVDSIQFE